MTDLNVDPPEELEAPEAPPEAPEAPPERDWNADARDMGWKPKDEWHGDPDGWRDAKEFVKRGDEIFGFIRNDRDRLREKNATVEADRDARLARMEKQYVGLLERQKAQHDADIKVIDADKRKAVEEGDTTTYDALTSKREALGDALEVPEAPPAAGNADVKAWAEKNTWFYTEPAARAMATAVAQTAADKGADVHAQTAAAEKEVRRRFPELFEQPKATVETGGSPLKPKSKTKGVGQLPPEARAGFKECVRLGMYQEDDIEKYAKSYWGQE